MKIKNNIKHYNVIYFLIVFLLFVLLPVGITLPVEAAYSISSEQALKDWLQNTNNVQTNNPTNGKGIYKVQLTKRTKRAVNRTNN